MGLEKFLDKNGVLFLWGKIKAAFATKDSATSTENGLMSSADKVKLDGIATGANKYVHPSYTPKESGLYKITVTKKFGVCYLNGGITLTGAVSGWVTLPTAGCRLPEARPMHFGSIWPTPSLDGKDNDK